MRSKINSLLALVVMLVFVVAASVAPARAATTYVLPPFGATAPTDIFDSNGTDIAANANGSFTITDNRTLATLLHSGYTVVSVDGIRPNICAGQATLVSGSPSTVTVTNACLTASTNVVLATNTTTAANGVKVVVAAGSMVITGPNTVTDVINWARVK